MVRTNHDALFQIDYFPATLYFSIFQKNAL